MATFEFTDPSGVKHRVTGPDGATEAEAFQILQGQLGSSSTPSLADAATPAVPDSAPTSLFNPPKAVVNTVDSAVRGAGLAARSITGAIPKAATGLSDLGSTILNFGIEGADRLKQGMGGDPINYRLNTSNTAALDSMLNKVFPEPTGFLERAADIGGNALFTGGLGGAALVPKAGSLSKAVPSLADEIGTFFAQNPKTAAAAELGGGAGTSMGGDLAADADAGPAGQLLGSLLGGTLGALAPSAGGRTLSGAAQLGRKVKEPLTESGVKTKAARELQSQAHDPAASARAARDAPDDITPARATEDPNIMALERKVLDDNPPLDRRVAEGAARAEARALDDLVGDLPAGRDKTAWQQEVIVRGAPDKAEIRVGEPSDMLDDAYKSFDGAYEGSRGFPVTTENMQVQGGNVPLRELFDNATTNSQVIADDNWRAGISKYLNGLLDDVSVKRGAQVGADDSPVYSVMSEDLLELRSTIRTKLRAKRRAGATNERAAAEAEMLDDAQKQITTVLESQLPDAPLENLRAVDLRYRDHKVVEDAVLRSGEKGLTPEGLRSALKASNSKGTMARGDTGDLGTLAASGKDVTSLFDKAGKTDDQIRRAVSAMDDATAQSTRADITRHLVSKASPGDLTTGQPTLSGKGLQKQIDTNRSALIAAGFDQADINRMDQIAKRLVMIQRKSPKPANKLIDDNLSALSGFLARVAGLKAAKKVVSAVGGGPILAITSFVSRQTQKVFKDLAFNDAEKMIADAMTDKELFAALMTRSTAKPVAQAKANRTLKAWIAQTGTTDDEDE